MPQDKFPKEVAVVLEQMDSKMDLVLESVTEWRRELVDRMDMRFAQHDARFDVIEGVLHQHSMRFTKIEDRLDRVENRLDRVENRLNGVDNRLGRMELKIDDVVGAVKRHDRELQELQVSR